MEDNKEVQPQPRPAAPAKRSRFPKLKKVSRFLRKFKASPLVLLILALAIGASAFFYTKYRDSQNKLNNPEIVAKAETQNLVEKVAQHVELPTGEQPTVATVSDVSKLSDQTFFAGAKNGDKVLIYTNAKKAILYRPSEDKVINFAPLNTNNTQ